MAPFISLTTGQNMNIVLASTSKYRAQQLNQLGLEFTTQHPNFDEDSLKSSEPNPNKLCLELSYQKAVSVFTKENQKNIVIGSDQLVYFEGQVLGKAGSIEAAADQLFKLQGKSHELITGICILHKDIVFREAIVTTLIMRELNYQQCLCYAKTDQTHDCAGSYKIEQAGIGLFANISTKDFSSIQGLPLMSLVDQLIALNYPIPFLNS